MLAFRFASSVCRQSNGLKNANQIRNLNLHEYQAQEIMKTVGVNVARGVAIKTPEEAFKAAKDINGDGAVIKAQVLAGGRGLGHFSNGFKGGVHIASTPEQAKDFASKMLGQQLITKQTGAAGKPCNTLYVCEKLKPKREMYFAILMDRKHGGPVVIASATGGTSIEDIAESDPSAIITEPIDIKTGMKPSQAVKIATQMRFPPHLIEQAADQIQKLYKLFTTKDCTLVEVNPFCETQDGRVVCLDAKIGFDDNAEFRQKDVFAQRDTSQEDPREVAAAKFDLNYIGLDGNIACLVNGAGLAMATMDIIKLHGGNPANFLDVGGSATEKQVTEAFKILNSDPNVKAILVNIFGGIMRCDTIAQGVINATKQVNMTIPIVCRLQGNQVERAKKLIQESGLKLTSIDDLDEAAKAAVKLTKQ
eukprot:TRINITY_DN592_c0_g1::TRINITY_DN592_c0_g1_i1::g.10467::m.10467 TRINITY_DN592_c0_g1::TRINITY_DN592_c0_g1_i1::g.10467  ORF type:complete len:433 (+),score=186.10,sp/P53587/SUCB_NEOFR/60.10/2e-171,ATP-grasp_2/PF08442.5/6.6e-73,Ligase_CoA/PF00549.14/7.6e-26,ATP-grasp_5/PF13549.1/6.6e-10,GARS_A/PF01071.14/0.0027,GARS_A/PF01071.14/23,Succ_CoA_lig/PF13607.1/0.032,SUI1/PF01253.17/13,SUI1/PF01253.17/8 TRINITY_DN592_c0_g1_i1:40-1299(+)